MSPRHGGCAAAGRLQERTVEQGRREATRSALRRAPQLGDVAVESVFASASNARGHRGSVSGSPPPVYCSEAFSLRREADANDLGAATGPAAVGARSNRSQSDQDPAEWLPLAAQEHYR